eukprot:5218655-Ditylum_brightwellii.AAC.1
MDYNEPTLHLPGPLSCQETKETAHLQHMYLHKNIKISTHKQQGRGHPTEQRGDTNTSGYKGNKTTHD